MLTVSVPQPHDFEGKTCKVGVCFISTPTPLGGATNVSCACGLYRNPSTLLKTVCHFLHCYFFLKKLSTTLTFPT